MYARRVAIGRHLRVLREAQGVSQTTLAEWAGLERKSIQRIETAAFVPSLERFIRIADALGVPASRLLDGDPGPAPGTGRAPGIVIRPAKARSTEEAPPRYSPLQGAE